MKNHEEQLLVVDTDKQCLQCYEGDTLLHTFPVSTGKNGLGELNGSECTPRGWHSIHSIIGLENEPNSVFVARLWTGEIYTPDLAAQHPGRDWILTRILQLDGLEPGRNKGGDVDSLMRTIYLHGTPDSTQLGKPGSRGCIRMRNMDIIALANWVRVGTKVFITS